MSFWSTAINSFASGLGSGTASSNGAQPDSVKSDAARKIDNIRETTMSRMAKIDKIEIIIQGPVVDASKTNSGNQNSNTSSGSGGTGNTQTPNTNGK